MTNIDISDKNIQIKLKNIAFHSKSSEWQWNHKKENGTHGDTLLWLVTGGEATLNCSYGIYNLHRGNFLVMPLYDNEYHGWQTSDNMLEVIWMIIQVNDINGNIIDTRSFSDIPFCQALHNVSFAEQLAKRIIHSRDDIQEYWIRVFLDEVRQQANINNESYQETCIRELCEKIKDTPALYNKLDKLLTEYNISKDHLIRLFRHYRGITPGEFIIQARIDTARKLLAMSSLSIKQIAGQLGYSDQFSFSRQFKVRVGVSPKKYRTSLFATKL